MNVTFTITRFEINDERWTTEIGGVIHLGSDEVPFTYSHDGPGPHSGEDSLETEVPVSDEVADFVCETCAKLFDEVYSPASVDVPMMQGMVGGLVRTFGENYNDYEVVLPLRADTGN